MRSTRLYSPIPLSVGAITDLDSLAAHHATKVLRLRPGAPLILFDGHGGEYRASLREVSGSNATALIHEHDPVERESTLELTLLQALAKGDRMDTAIQKAVELGVSRIVPVYAERSVVKLKPEREQKRLRHWRGVIRAACEQCGRNRLPAIETPRAFEAALAAISDKALRLVLAPGNGRRLGQLERHAHVALLVGPEGGLTDAELGLAESRGYQAIHLGPRILRTETAGIALMAALQSRWGDMA